MLFFFDACAQNTIQPPPLLRTPSPRNSGKTSLLFHYARSVATSTGSPVYLLTSASAAAAGPPLLPATAASAVTGAGEGGEGGATTAGGPVDPFDLVQMKYVSSIADVVAFAACLHLLESEDGGLGGQGKPSTSSLPRRPAAVVVDGLSSLPPDEACSRRADRRAVEHAVLRALAMLSDATGGAWRRRVRRNEEQGALEGGGGGGGDKGRGASSSSSSSSLCPIALVVAEESAPDGRAPFYLYRRWLPLVLTVRPAHEGFGDQLHEHHHPQHQHLLSLAPLPAAAGGASVPSDSAAASAAALYSFEGAGELEALGVAV